MLSAQPSVARSQLLLGDKEVEEDEKECNKEEPVQQSTAEPQQHITFNFDLKLRNVLSFALPGCLGVVLLCLLILLLFRRPRSPEDVDHMERGARSAPATAQFRSRFLRVQDG